MTVLPTDQRRKLQAEMERMVTVVRDRIVAVERKVGKSSLTPEEGFDLWEQLRQEGIQAALHLATVAGQQKGYETSCTTCANGVCCNGRVDVVLMDAVPILRAKDEAKTLTQEFLDQCRERNREELSSGRPNVWMARRTPCLFLRNGRCSVYAQRPLPCAQFYVWSDPVYCLDMDPHHLVALRSPVQKMLHVALGGLVDRLIGTYDAGSTGTTLPGALWVMGMAWPLHKDPREFRREVSRLYRKVMLNPHRNSSLPGT